MAMKIVLIGAGSRSFGRGQIVDVLTSKELCGRDVTFTLVDEDEAALDLMTQFANRVKTHTGTDITIESATDRCFALPDADYVIVSVARKRMELWEQDFRVPLAYGFRHCLGENGGPGAVFHALRSLDLVIPICRDVERICPDALVMNFTNPEARVLHAIRRLTDVKAAGFCHGVFSAIDFLARCLDRPADRLEIISAGMNHFYCILRVTDRDTGEDLLGKALDYVVNDRSGDVPPLFRKIAEVFGIFSFPSDDHIGEYLSFGAEYSGVKWHYGREIRPVSDGPEAAAEPLEDYALGRRPLEGGIIKPSGELTVPLICDIELDRGTFRPAVNVLNDDGYIENLPRNGVVEVPATVDASGLHPLKVGSLPEPFAAYIRTQFTIIELVTEAYQTRSRKLLLQALLLDPLVDGIASAEQMLDDMLELQKDYLPKFSYEKQNR